MSAILRVHYHSNITIHFLTASSHTDRAQSLDHPSVPQQPIVNGHSSSTSSNTNGVVPPAVPSIASGPVPSQAYPQAPRTPVSFTPDQINALRVQIHAFKLISRGLPVPEPVQQAIRVPSSAIPDLEKLLQGQDVNARVVDSTVKMLKGSDPTTLEAHTQDTPKSEEHDVSVNQVELPKGPFIEEDVSSGIYPYNAYRHPFTHIKRNPTTDPSLFATRLQRLLIPSIMPAGLDAHQLVSERDRFIEARMQQRIRELEAMPATMGEGGFESIVHDSIKEDKENAQAQSLPPSTNHHISFPDPNTHGKLKAMIELKSLRVLDKQRALRALVAERQTHGSLLPLNRADFRRTRKPTIRDARSTERLERKQRADRERRAKHKHVEQLGVICTHGREMLAVNRAAQDRIIKLGRAVLSFHAFTEKEEQKRIERISKERLKALKADDEEAYMKLIDTAKDTRITHLLRQTDTYLDSLAQAVVAQQNESGHSETMVQFETEDGPANEATFGAQVAADDVQEDKTRVDYYAVAHRISEKVSSQPRLLTGGTLKEYQLKGLQWMVSLYNNRLNGILADEMVRHPLCGTGCC